MSTVNRHKILNDPVYGFVTLRHERALDLMDHRFMQRLRRISQLGLSHLVYPGAVHNRFHHAVGCMHLMQEAIDSNGCHTHLTLMRFHVNTRHRCHTRMVLMRRTAIRRSGLCRMHVFVCKLVSRSVPLIRFQRRDDEVSVSQRCDKQVYVPQTRGKVV